MSDDANPPRQHNEREQVDSWNLRRFHHAIAERIGQELQRRYQPPKDLPHRLLALLLQINRDSTPKPHGSETAPE